MITQSEHSKDSVLLQSVRDIDLKTYEAICWDGRSVLIDSAPLEFMASIRSSFLQDLDKNVVPVYGVNVGAGDGSSKRLATAEQEDYKNGLNSATSFGRTLPERVVRGIIVSRLASFLGGHSAVTPELAQHVAAMLDEPLPQVPAEGSGGSGEILPLGHLFARVPSSIELGLKESMSLVNGSPCAGALASDLSVRGKGILELVQEVFVLALDALDTPMEHFDMRLAEVWDNPNERKILERLSSILMSGKRQRRTHQARVSARIFPRVFAVMEHEFESLRVTAERALRGAGDNPAFLHSENESSTIASNGSFHNQEAIVGIDRFNRAMADITQLGQHFIHALYQDKDAMPEQDNLALGTAFMVAADWSEEARLQANPSLISFAAIGQNDVTNPIFRAWRASVRIEEALISQMALLSVMASQSLYTTGKSPLPDLEQLVNLIREDVPVIDNRRDVGNEIHALAKRFTQHIYSNQRQSAFSLTN